MQIIMIQSLIDDYIEMGVDPVLFDNSIEPGCAYCRFSTDLGYNEIACDRRGIMTASGSCGSFRYEPTKRVPYPAPGLDLSGLSEDDFVI